MSRHSLHDGKPAIQEINSEGQLNFSGGRANLTQGIVGDGALAVFNQGSLTVDSICQGVVEIIANGHIR